MVERVEAYWREDQVGLTIMFGRGDWWRGEGEAETWGLGSMEAEAERLYAGHW